jgi:glutaredoxin 3
MADVVIYTRPFCGYCARAISLLSQKGVPFTEIDAGMDPDKRREMVQRSGGRNTYPQNFIAGEHIGGCDEMMALERAGELDPLLSAA